MSLLGTSLIAGKFTTPGTPSFHAHSPLQNAPVEPAFFEATPADVDAALTQAEAARAALLEAGQTGRAALLERIAEEILALGDALLQRAHLETGLPLDRLTGERGRTVGQLRLFAALLREGSWCDARIDTALPERQPLPRPDLRRVLRPLGNVVVFGASNFPLAFSVAGGDTASALAAGCPVVVKGHPAHPGTSELAATAIARAVEACALPAGVFALLQGRSNTLGEALVRHPLTSAVGFTGSLRGGRALLDAAASRPVPIPVFAEMGSLNPIFVLPGALRERGAQIAEGLKTSITAGCGQFCTKPGLVFGPGGEAFSAFRAALQSAMESVAPGTMLHAGISESYAKGAQKTRELHGVSVLAESAREADAALTQGRPAVFGVSSETFRAQPSLHEELFGPSSVLVEARDLADLLQIARSLDGQLTATVHAAESDLVEAAPLLRELEQKAGRLILNGFPTGVEVSPAMNHGGPYPASTDSRFTAVGTAAIQRWARPVCFQNFPDALLPDELRATNPLGLMRLVNGVPTRE